MIREAALFICISGTKPGNLILVLILHGRSYDKAEGGSCMNYANLHLHSFFSDGVFTPQQLCALAKQKGYGAVAVSDHETARGVEFMRLAAKELGLEFISAMETYAFDFGTQFHILAYDFDPNEPHLHAYTTEIGAFL